MTTYKDWFIFSAVAALLVFSPAAIGGLTFSVSPSSIVPGERARLQITLEDSTIPEHEEMVPTINDKMLDLNPKIQILDRVFRKEGGKYYWEYQITSHRVENLRIPPIEIQAGPNTYSTESQEIAVVSERHDGDDVARPEFDEIPPPVQWKKWFKIMGVATLLTVLVTLISHFAEKLKKVSPARKPVEPTEDEHPLVWFQRELTLLKKRAHHSTVSAKELDELTRLLRIYYSKETKNPVDTWTSREFKKRFESDENAQKISSVFDRMDRTRFLPNVETEVATIFGNCVAETERVLLPWTA